MKGRANKPELCDVSSRQKPRFMCPSGPIGRFSGMPVVGELYVSTCLDKAFFSHQLRCASAVYRAKPTSSSCFFSQLKPGQSSCLFVWMLIGPGVLCLEFRLEISDCLPTSLLDLWSLFSVGASRNTLKYCKFLIPISNPNTK